MRKTAKRCPVEIMSVEKMSGNWTLAMYRQSFADTPPLHRAAAVTGGVWWSMAVFGGVKVIRGG